MKDMTELSEGTLKSYTKAELVEIIKAAQETVIGLREQVNNQYNYGLEVDRKHREEIKEILNELALTMSALKCVNFGVFGKESKVISAGGLAFLNAYLQEMIEKHLNK